MTCEGGKSFGHSSMVIYLMHDKKTCKKLSYYALIPHRLSRFVGGSEDVHAIAEVYNFKAHTVRRLVCRNESVNPPSVVGICAKRSESFWCEKMLVDMLVHFRHAELSFRLHTFHAKQTTLFSLDFCKQYINGSALECTFMCNLKIWRAVPRDWVMPAKPSLVRFSGISGDFPEIGPGAKGLRFSESVIGNELWNYNKTYARATLACPSYEYLINGSNRQDTFPASRTSHFSKSRGSLFAMTKASPLNMATWPWQKHNNECHTNIANVLGHVLFSRF